MKGTYITIVFAGVAFELHYEEPVIVTDHFLPFVREKSSADYRIDFSRVKQLPEIKGDILTQTLEYRVFRTADGFIRQFHDHKNHDIPYAVTYCDLVHHHVQVDYLPGAERFFCETGNSFFHIGWERLMIQEKRMILHASCVNTPMGGILFSGPSGIGKSTQADLWCRYADGELINGDRPVLCRQNKKWQAYGSPYAGSSQCHRDASCSVCAVVLLKQASECRIRRMDRKEAFSGIYTGATVNSWDTIYVEQICDLITELIGDIPVYELICTPDIRAVDLLRNMLMEEVII